MRALAEGSAKTESQTPDLVHRPPRRSRKPRISSTASGSPSLPAAPPCPPSLMERLRVMATPSFAYRPMRYTKQLSDLHGSGRHHVANLVRSGRKQP